MLTGQIYVGPDMKKSVCSILQCSIALYYGQTHQPVPALPNIPSLPSAIVQSTCETCSAQIKACFDLMQFLFFFTFMVSTAACVCATQDDFCAAL